MKIKPYVIVLLVFFIGQQISAQDSMKKIEPSKILFVSDIKTTHLIFDEPITYVDLGSPYFIADTVQTLVKLRHVGEDVNEPISLETNLTVITKDGAFHSIPLKYKRGSKDLTYRISSSVEYVEKPRLVLEEEEQKKIDVQKLADQIKFAEPNVYLINKKDDFDIGVTGIFYEKDFIALRLVLKNTSAIDIDIDHVLMRLKLKGRVSPDYIYQERIIKPLHILNQITRLEGNTTKTTTLIFDKFTPNKNEVLTIDVLEKNGGRSAKIKVPRKKLINPKAL